MFASSSLRLGLIATVLLAAGALAVAQDQPPQEIPLTEQIARNHEARQRGEEPPYPDAEKEYAQQSDAGRERPDSTRTRRPVGRQDGGTPAISPGGAAGTPAAPANPDPAGRTRVALQIGVGDEDWGWIVVELTDDKTPQTVANFLRYVDSGFYNGVVFHRIKPRYIAQAGGFLPDWSEKTDGLQPPVPNEAARGEKNKRGTIGVARSRHDPNSGTSQFYFNLVDNPRLDHGTDNPGYCVFGRITDGLDVLERIGTTRVRRSTLVTNEVSMPTNPPQIKAARRLAPGEPAPVTAAPQPDGQPASPEKPTPAGNPGEPENRREAPETPKEEQPAGDPPNEKPSA